MADFGAYDPLVPLSPIDQHLATKSELLLANAQCRFIRERLSALEDVLLKVEQGLQIHMSYAARMNMLEVVRKALGR